MSFASNATALEAVQRLYARSQPSVDFAAVLQQIGPLDDTALAELIETDGRQRLLRRESVDLNRYLVAVPDLLTREDPLDAAIDVTLRSMSGGSRINQHAVAQLTETYPQLEESIRETAMLNDSIWSTTGLKNRFSASSLPPKSLPCEFGPMMTSGSDAGAHRRYQLQQLLGQGGFGQVYLARDRQLSEEGHSALVAIKILATEHRSPSARQRLIEEATKVRRISHPNVVVVLDRGVTEHDEDYIVYEYVDGGDLNALISEKSLIPMREAAALMAKIAHGVHAAHSAGVIHCDLKPSNIMLTIAHEPKVADFGIAVRLEQATGDQLAVVSGHLEVTNSRSSAHAVGSTAAREPNGLTVDISHRAIGSIAFISPEQFRGEDHGLSVPSDVYALGGILYLMLTGQLPNGNSLEAIARNHDANAGRIQPPPVRAWRAEVDRDLEAICHRAMAVNVKDRYNSAAPFAEDLERWLNNEPIAWLKPGVWRTMRLWARRKPALAIAMAAILIVLLAGSFVAARFASIANANALEAAKAQLKADAEENERLRSRATAAKYATALRRVGDYRMSTDTLLIIWALEYVYGPKVLGMPEEASRLWENRVIHIRHLVQTAHAEGRANELETLLWESALGYWLVCGKDFAEAQPLLRANIEKWERILSPNDLWLADLNSMLLCAEANRLAAQARSGTENSVDREELVHLEGELLAACERIPYSHKGTPVHYMLLGGLIDMYGPTLLNLPEKRDATATYLKRFIDRKSLPPN